MTKSTNENDVENLVNPRNQWRVSARKRWSGEVVTTAISQREKKFDMGHSSKTTASNDKDTDNIAG
jgi:hypothetical protein